jgi:16S rRNA (adenine(1408)-N(1))-methyltransferase
MEIIRGKQTSCIDASEFNALVSGYETVHMDIGTGDGRFVRHVARSESNCFVVGIDASRENLRETSRSAPSNALFVIANALRLPPEFRGLADTITINFPWGSLLKGLLTNDPALMVGLVTMARPNASLEVRLNGGALAEAGWSLEEGAHRVREVLAVNGFEVCPPIWMAAYELRSYPTTWAKRLAFGRDPRAVCLRAMSRAAVLAHPTQTPDEAYRCDPEYRQRA